MMKKAILIVGIMGLILASGGCGMEPVSREEIAEEGDAESTGKNETLIQEEESSSQESPELTIVTKEAEFSFSDLSTVQFWFSSGAGAWSTVLNIRDDGSFFGEYVDSDMGVIEVGYPNGTQYQSNFSGQFTEPVQVNDYTWSMEIAQLNYEREPGTEEIRDGVLYRYSEAYGLEDAEEILLYLPGAPLEDLPQEFRSWIGYSDLSRTEETVLPFYGLNNEVHQEGFTGNDLKDRLKEVEAEADVLERELQEDGSLKQGDLNEKTQEIYSLWDSFLNEIWQRLKQTQAEEQMEALTQEEREWISWKEEQIAAAGEEFAGGSMESMVRARKGADLTKERVYQLMDVLEGK